MRSQPWRERYTMEELTACDMADRQCMIAWTFTAPHEQGLRVALAGVYQEIQRKLEGWRWEGLTK